MPSLKNISKIFPEQHSFKTSILINHVDPLTLFPVSHNFKGFPERFVLLNTNVLWANIFEEGANLNFVIGAGGGFVGYA